MDRKSLNRLLMLSLLVCAIVYGGFVLASEFRPTPQAGPALARPAFPEIEELGDPKAQLHVELYVPVGAACHAKTLELVRTYVEDHSGQVRATILPMGSPQAKEKMRLRGATCATVFINGQSSFLLEKDGKQHRVTFYRSPNEAMSTYHSEDVIRVLDQKLREQKD